MRQFIIYSLYKAIWRQFSSIKFDATATVLYNSEIQFFIYSESSDSKQFFIYSSGSWCPRTWLIVVYM